MIWNYGLLGSQIPPRCSSGDSPDASHMPARWFPHPWFLLYNSCCNGSSAMIPRHCFLFCDSANWFAKELCLGSRAGVILLLKEAFCLVAALALLSSSQIDSIRYCCFSSIYVPFAAWGAASVENLNSLTNRTSWSPSWRCSIADPPLLEEILALLWK